MTEKVIRFAQLVVKAGSDQFAGGLRELYHGLTEERARRFISWLASSSQERRSTAENSVKRLLESSNGTKILRHICRDVLFGTESVSLGALALIAGEASENREDPFWPRAANAVDGLQDDDATIFVALLRYAGDFTVQKEWLAVCHFDVAYLVGKPHWTELRILYGLGDTEVYCGISEAIQRRLFVPDTSSGRLGGHGDVAPRTFYLSPETARYYRILGRALELAQPERFGILAPLDFDEADRICAGPSTGRPPP
jgi:hypothetical protein